MVEIRAIKLRSTDGHMLFKRIVLRIIVVSCKEQAQLLRELVHDIRAKAP